MKVMLELEMLLGLGAVALWTHLRFPGLRPRSLLRAAVHLAVAVVVFGLVPTLLGVVLPLEPSPYTVLALLMPTLTYVLLSWLWLVARIVDLLRQGPRGGHPAASEEP